MRMDLKYLGRSGVTAQSWGMAMRFAPNLARPKVFYDAEVKHPLRFREAISALHEVVVGDLRFKKRDKAAYEQWRAEQDRLEAELRAQIVDAIRGDELAKISRDPIPANLEADFRKMHDLYWTARRQWARELAQNDPALFRSLVPCDPVVTVAPDIVYFECFAKDESSYGCLTVDRDAFQGEQGAGLGTTNVDYSLALYEHFQTLRTYRPTRLQVDPTGFEVKVEGREEYREEKIDLPPSWLRGFGQIQAAMALPARKVILPVELVYSLLAHLKRHREKTGPRSLRFQLVPGKPPVVVIEPWGISLVSRGAVYQGDRPEEIKVWGRRRLMSLARVLPLAERVEVQLLGTGMPSMWVAHLGEMRFMLALSGWTANDWTSGSNLELLTGNLRSDARTADALAAYLETSQKASLAVLEKVVSAPRDVLLGSLNLLAKQGQLVYDFSSHVYRYRQVMPVALSETLLGPPHPELAEGRRLFATGSVKVMRAEPLAKARSLYAATIGKTEVEAIFDLDGAFTRAKCGCSHFRSSGLRAGPCRHLLALRLAVQSRDEVVTEARPLAPAQKADAPPGRRRHTLHFAKSTLTELQDTAALLDRSVGAVLEEAWRAAKARVEAAPTRMALPAGDASSKVTQELLLADDVAEGMQQEANRLDTSLSAISQAAWSLGRDEVKKGIVRH